MKFRNLLVVIASLIALMSCKSEYEMLLNSNDADAKYEAAFQYFNENKFSKAASLFESLSVLADGTERGDTVKYYFDSNDNIVRIERIGKKDSVITEIASIKNTADESKIKKPSGFDISKLVD